MRNVTPGRNAKACRVLPIRTIIWTRSCPCRSARSDNLLENDEISGQIERLFLRSRTLRVAGFESTGKSLIAGTAALAEVVTHGMFEMNVLTRIAAVTCCAIAIGMLSSKVATAASARSMLAELSALEKEVKSISAMGPTGADRYSQKVSDFRSRFFKVSDVTPEQRRDVSKRLSAVSSEIRKKTTQTGGAPAKPRSTTRSRTSSSKLSSSRSRLSTVRPRSSSSRSRSSFSSSSTSRSGSSSRSATQKMGDIYVEVSKRFDKLPKAIRAKSGLLKTEDSQC